MSGSTQRVRVWMMGALAVALAVPSLAQAQSTKPTVTTRAAADVTSSSVTLLGTIRPNGARTTYFFQYGTTRVYGAVTPTGTVPGTTGAVTITAAVTGLAPFTRYHYRLVAQNRNGIVNGADHSFRTLRQPLGLDLAATPNPVPFGRPAVLGGTLTGTGNANRPILLQANPFPYTQGFQPTANVQLTNAQGQFAFPLLSIPINTQYRVMIPDRPGVASPILSLGVAVRVGTNVSATRVRTGRIVRFLGTVRPARPGAPFAIQRLRRGAWTTVAGGITHGSARGVSRYAKRVRIRRGGQYRVFVAIADGNYVSAAGRTVRITRLF